MKSVRDFVQLMEDGEAPVNTVSGGQIDKVVKPIGSVAKRKEPSLVDPSTEEGQKQNDGVTDEDSDPATKQLFQQKQAYNQNYS